MRVRLELEVLEILGVYRAADMVNMARISAMVVMTCPCMKDQKERSRLLNFSGFFGGPEGLSYLQHQKFMYEKSL